MDIKIKNINNICPKVNVLSLGYIVDIYGNIVEIDLNHEHYYIFSIIINKIFNTEDVTYTREQGFNILTRLGYIVYYGPLEREEIKEEIIDYNVFYNGYDFEKCNRKYIINTNINRRDFLCSALWLPKNYISEKQKKFVNELFNSNIDDNQKEICNIECGYFKEGLLSDNELERVLKRGS